MRSGRVGLLAFVVLAASSLAPAQAQTSQAASLARKSPAGSWIGTFQCGNARPTAFFGINYDNMGNLAPTFGFGKMDKLPGGRPYFDFDGKYNVDVTFDRVTRSLQVKPGSWLTRPMGSADVIHPLRGTPAGLSLQLSPDGKKLTGTVQHPSCGKIELTEDGPPTSAEDYYIRESLPGATRSSPYNLPLAKTAGLYLSWNYYGDCNPPVARANMVENRQGALADPTQLAAVEKEVRRVMPIWCPSAEQMTVAIRPFDTPEAAPKQMVDWAFADTSGWKGPAGAQVAAAPRGWAPSYMAAVETLPSGSKRFEAAYAALRTARPLYVEATKKAIVGARVAAPIGVFADRAATEAISICLKSKNSPVVAQGDLASICYFAGLGQTGFIEQLQPDGKVRQPDRLTSGWSSAKSFLEACAKEGGPRDCALLMEYGAEATSMAGEITQARELARNAPASSRSVEAEIKAAAQTLDRIFRNEDAACLTSSRDYYASRGLGKTQSLKVCSEANPKFNGCTSNGASTTCSYTCMTSIPMSQVEYCAQAACGYGMSSVRRMCDGPLVKLDFFAESLGSGLVAKPSRD